MAVEILLRWILSGSNKKIGFFIVAAYPWMMIFQEHFVLSFPTPDIHDSSQATIKSSWIPNEA